MMRRGIGMTSYRFQCLEIDDDDVLACYQADASSLSGGDAMSQKNFAAYRVAREKGAFAGQLEVGDFMRLAKLSKRALIEVALRFGACQEGWSADDYVSGLQAIDKEVEALKAQRLI